MDILLWGANRAIDGLVLVEIDGKKGLISSITGTFWNFQKFTPFTNEIFTELADG